MSLALLIASILSSVVGAEPAIPAGIRAIVTSLSSIFSAIVKSGVTTTVNATTVLTALEGVIGSLKGVPGITPATAAALADLAIAAQAAQQADATALQGVDLTKLLPIAPLPLPTGGLGFTAAASTPPASEPTPRQQ